ncbi:MAG TPA: GNAT family N-acetyltransferase [Polyangiaceae bacterium]|nr:GNAT family N-acetyltransferase [Polyangiaceae bacterium]
MSESSGERAHEFRVEPLDVRRHARDGFFSGVESLDQYLKKQAGQDMRRKANAVFVLVRVAAPNRIIGYFTLCALALGHGGVPEAARKLVPRYPLVSATLLGRLAIAKESQGRGFGSVLLARALRKAYENADVVGSCMIVVDPIDDRASRFYQAHGFQRLVSSPRLVLPMRTIGDLFMPETR